MNKQQTAVEWLIQELTPAIALQQKYIDELEIKAKEMEKKQIIEAYLSDRFPCSDADAEQYYNETYGK